MARLDRNDPMPTIREQLRDRAHVFEDPESYVAGVEDALGSVRALEEEDSET